MADDLRSLLQVATAAAREAGAVLVREQANARSSVGIKASVMDVVTDVDRMSEAVVVDRIDNQFPHDGIVGEEGSSRGGTTGRRWIIDPLDGTVNFIRGWRTSAVSIGVEVDGEFMVGVVYNPFHDELFSGAKNEGAFLNGERLHPQAHPVSWDQAYVGVDGGYELWARAERAEIVRLLELQAGGMRCIGSTTLSLCHLAMGRYDAVTNTGCSIWDIAAGTVIAREAGCLVEGVQPGSQPSAERTLAARPELLGALRQTVEMATNSLRER
jgi:myo-inositol-1(or 4)-monophosphatase